MKHETLLPLPDVEFLKWSHISEKWLYQYLLEHADVIDLSKEELSEIIEDERRHVSIFKNLLNVFGIAEHTNIKKSFHHSIYSELGGIQWHLLTPEKMKAMLAISERRAVFLYRAYIKNGKNEQIKKTLKAVLQDELGHARAYSDENEPAFVWAAELDKRVWTDLEKKYGLSAQQEQRFWMDLQNSELATISNKDIPLS